MKNSLLTILLFLAIAGLGNLAAQTLPEVDEQITSRNYFEICKQLDAYFAKEYTPETDCPDNDFVKYQRWKWWWRDRVNADGSFPELRDQWLESLKKSSELAANRNNQPTWQHEGPVHNPSQGYWGMGRVKNIAFHPTNPDIMWVGTPDGGIWKTTDYGQTWTSLGDGLPYLPVSIILVNPQNPDILYISLGDKGGWWNWNMGVYKTTDGGQTWSPTGLDWKLADNNVIYNMVMSPADPEVIFAASNRGVLRTQDGGQTWQTVRNGEYSDVELKTGDPNTIYAAHYDYWGTSQVDKSTDGGDTWNQITQFTDTQNDIRLAVSPLKPDWLAVHFSNGHRLFLSKDGGQTYTENVAPEDDWGIFAFSPTDTNTIYLCGVVVHRSTDQGATWDAITHWYNDGIHPEVHADAHDLVYTPHSQNQLWYCNDGGIYRYDESVNSWIDFSDGLPITQFYRIDISQTGSANEVKIMAGSQDNGGWLRTNTTGWKHTNGGDAMCQIIDPKVSSIQYTEYYGGNDIYRSTDNFVNSVNIADNIPDNPSGDWVTPFILNPQNNKTFIVALHDVYQSFDRGDHFHRISDTLTGSVDNKIRDIVMSPSDTNVIAVAANGNRVYTTTNGGQNWTIHAVPSSEEITRLAIHPTNPQRMWATRGGYTAAKKVYSTINGGITWQNRSGNLPNVPANCIIYDSTTNYLFVGTDIGVYYSDANVINWQPYGIGLPNVYVLDLKIRNITRKLYIATHGRGVYSIDLEQLTGAQTPQSDQLAATLYPNPAHTQLFFKTGSGEIFDGKIELFNATGQLALVKTVHNMPLHDQVLDIAALPDGMYFLRAVDIRGKVLLTGRAVKE